MGARRDDIAGVPHTRSLGQPPGEAVDDAHANPSVDPTRLSANRPTGRRRVGEKRGQAMALVDAPPQSKVLSRVDRSRARSHER
jgi:hypothetical protein